NVRAEAASLARGLTLTCAPVGGLLILMPQGSDKKGNKEGDEQDILTLSPPAPEWTEPLHGLYKLWDAAHAGGVWARDLEWRLGSPGEASLSHDRFYVAPHGKQAAAALDVSRSPDFLGLGIAHRVFAHPTMRRKGLAGRLVEAAKQDFRRSRGRLLILVAPSTGPASDFYRGHSFGEAVRAKDGETLFGWAARGRHVREALLRFLKHEPVSWREATPGDWAALVAYSALPGGRPDSQPATLRDHEWAEVFEALRPEKKPFTLEVGESRHGYVVSVRVSAGEKPLTAAKPPEWLVKLASAGA
ncbi:MAG: GNAT family N-acetyltransferase, partial [Planctomycetota bacterium]